jgi:PIN domain
MILLDTNIVVAYLNGNEPVASKVVENINKITLSTLVVAELDYGAKASQNSLKNLSNLNRSLEFGLEFGGRIRGTPYLIPRQSLFTALSPPPPRPPAGPGLLYCFNISIHAIFV